LVLRAHYDDTRVFRIEPDKTTGILGSLGPFPQPMRVELLDESCAVITIMNMPSSACHSMVVIRPDRTLVLAQIPDSDEIAPGIPEVRGGECGGLP
jgi:hypothetical protein